MELESLKSVFDEDLEFLAKNYHPIYINIIGLSGTGKTNLAFILGKKISEIWGLNTFYFHTQPERIENEGVHIFDDFTYLLKLHSKEALDFARHVQLIRHDYPQHMAIIFISHYVHSLLPIFRNTQMRFLLSITSHYEINQLRRYFDLNHLWNFYYVYTGRLQHRALVNCLGRHYIIQIPLSQLYRKIMILYDGKIPKVVSLSEMEGDISEDL